MLFGNNIDFTHVINCPLCCDWCITIDARNNDNNVIRGKCVEWTTLDFRYVLGYKCNDRHLVNSFSNNSTNTIIAGKTYELCGNDAIALESSEFLSEKQQYNHVDI